VANDVTLLLKLNDQVSRQLSKIKQGAKGLEKAFEKNGKAVRNLEAAFQRMGRKGIRSFRDLESNAARLGKRMSGLRGNIAKAGVAFAAFRAVQAGIARAESERRLKLLGQRFGEVGQLQGAAAAAARKFNLSQTEANQSLANAFARLRPLGVSLKDITSTFGGFRTAAVLGGATAAEASAAFTQLSQALGSGALRGDEFRSIAEQAPLVLQAISDETGIAAGQLKEYAAQGLLTSDIVIKALKRIEAEGAGRLAQALDGPAGKIKEFQNAFEEVQVAATETIIPELSKSFVILAGIITDLKPVIKGVGDFAATVLGGIARTVERIRDPGKLASEVQTDRARKLMAKGISLRRLTGSGMSNIPALSAADQKLLFGAKPVAAPKGTTTVTKPEKKSDTVDTDPLAGLKEQVKQLKLRNALAAAGTKEEKLQAQLLFDIAELTAIRTDDNAALVDEAIKLTGKLVYQNQLNSEAERIERERAKQAKVLNDLYQQVGDTVSTAIVDSLMQAKSVTEALGGALQNIGRQLAQLGINTLLKSTGLGIFSALPGFANGGRPPVGRPSIVGERGPELFVPSRSGTIIPNHAMGGASVTVNVDASGSQVQGNQPGAKALGSAIGAAVQAELIKQKRPGGLLAI
jgi:tape measure domain-containing protein|tara:strand:+ start:38 stop:1942 length:1905 start_codon:yes stop_codon:yes gene_type:complete